MKVLAIGVLTLAFVSIAFARVGAQVDEDLGVETPRCYDAVGVVGEERPTRTKAMRAAENAWMGNVRYDYGERYQDLNRAEEAKVACAPSSTTTILKRVFFRCLMSAKPCQAQPEILEQSPDLGKDDDY